MVPGNGRLPAEKIKEHVVKKVESFGLNFKTDILNGTNDGCTTMEKYGDLIKKLIQLCLAHGIQLGVVKGIYKEPKKKKTKKTTEIEVEENDSDVEENDSDVEEYDEIDSDDDLISNLGEDDDRSVFDDDELDEQDETGLVNEAVIDTLELKGNLSGMTTTESVVVIQ